MLRALLAHHQGAENYMKQVFYTTVLPDDGSIVRNM